MTQTKLQNILSVNYGISDVFDRWLKLPQISIIYLEQDANIYINDNMIFYFNSDDMTLNLSQHYSYVRVDGNDLGDDITKYRITSRFDINSISGFISSVVSGPYGSYINRRF